MRLKNKYAELSNLSVISYGPCQFPTLGFVVEQYDKIKNFKNEKFWSIKCEIMKENNIINNNEIDNNILISDDENNNHNDNRIGNSRSSKSFQFHWSRGNIFDRYAVTVLFDLCLKNIQNAFILDISGKDTSRKKPNPLNTVSLQMKVSQYLHINSENTMHAAEKLYQKGYISYPRTETDYFKEGR